MTEPLDFDPYSDVFFNDPYDVYRRLRDEAPVYRNDHYGFYALSRYEDVAAAHRDWRTFTSTQGITIDMLTEPGTSDLLKAAKGSIILIGSMYSYFGNPMIPAYTAAKTAIVGLTKSLAVAYAEDGIRVNAIAPGWINTEISKSGREEPAFNNKVMGRLPTKRWSEPEELAGTAVLERCATRRDASRP